MVNRVLQAKVMKMRRRNRYVRLSGGDTKIELGKVSFSKQVINTGHRPDINHRKAVLMQPPQRRLWEDIPKTLGLSIERELAMTLAVALQDQDIQYNNRIIDGRKVKVFVFFDIRLTDIYLIRIDERRGRVEKSNNFRSIHHAQEGALSDRTVWRKV